MHFFYCSWHGFFHIQFLSTTPSLAKDFGGRLASMLWDVEVARVEVHNAYILWKKKN